MFLTQHVVRFCEELLRHQLCGSAMVKAENPHHPAHSDPHLPGVCISVLLRKLAVMDCSATPNGEQFLASIFIL